MSQCYFLNTGRRILGPFDAHQLKDLNRRGKIKSEYMISTDRRAWKTVDELFPEPASQAIKADRVLTTVEKEWCVSTGDEQFVRIGEQALRRQLDAGEVSPDTLIWAPGSSEWQEAGDVFSDLALPPRMTDQPPSKQQNSAPTTLVVSAPHERKDKIVAALLALFIGGLGLHRFYLGNIVWGLLYLLFCWTLIPAMLSLIEGIMFLVMSQDEFDRQYNAVHVSHLDA